MTYAQLDFLADRFNVVLAIVVIAGALWLERAAAWQFLLRAIVATVLVQQLAKSVQKASWLGPHFPSTHFAVALCLATFLFVLHRKWGAIGAVCVALYGALMLYQKYHTPLEMLGAFYAIPLALFSVTWKRADARAVSRPK